MTSQNGNGQPDEQASDRPIRDHLGRFRPGCSGNPRGRPKTPTIAETLRKLLEEGTPGGGSLREALAKRLVVEAGRGDVRAAQLVLQYVDGRPSTIDERVNLELPALVDASSCRQASAVVLAALGRGEIGLDAATKLTSIIDGARRCVETQELEERLAELERDRFAGRSW